MNELTLFIALATALVLVTGFFDVPIQRSILTEPLITMVCGIVAGPYVLSWFRPDEWGVDKMEVLSHFAKYTMAMALMATALRLPGRYPIESAKFQLTLILVGVALMSLLSAGIFYAILGSSALMCLLLGAIVAPTDPVLATTIVSGRVARQHISARLRYLISGESGANDGLAFPFVMLPFLLIDRPEGAWREWLLRVVLYENVLGILLGALCGFVAREFVKRAMKSELMDSKALLSITIALAFFTLEGLELIKCNGIIGVFAAGLAFNYHMSKNPEAQEERVQEMMERVFVGPIFLFFGILIPWGELAALGWKAWAIGLLVLAFRRLPALFALKPALAPLRNWRDAAFAGWFGPIGVAALYYSTHFHSKLHDPLIWTIPCLVVFASVVAHALTSFPFAKAYAKGEGKQS